jgi:hypothetical protein
MIVVEKKEQLLNKEELCEQEGKKVFLFDKKKKRWTEKKSKIKVHIIRFFFFNNSYLSIVSVELLIVVLFIWITQCNPCYVIESELVYY